ncbi:MAG: hypothetical protein V3S01_09570 [Dehalococcoidia bacterium]
MTDETRRIVRDALAGASQEMRWCQKAHCSSGETTNGQEAVTAALVALDAESAVETLAPLLDAPPSGTLRAEVERLRGALRHSVCCKHPDECPLIDAALKPEPPGEPKEWAKSVLAFFVAFDVAGTPAHHEDCRHYDCDGDAASCEWWAQEPASIDDEGEPIVLDCEAAGDCGNGCWVPGWRRVWLLRRELLADAGLPFEAEALRLLAALDAEGEGGELLAARANTSLARGSVDKLRADVERMLGAGCICPDEPCEWCSRIRPTLEWARDAGGPAAPAPTGPPACGTCGGSEEIASGTPGMEDCPTPCRMLNLRDDDPQASTMVFATDVIEALEELAAPPEQPECGTCGDCNGFEEQAKYGERWVPLDRGGVNAAFRDDERPCPTCSPKGGE